MTCIMWVYRIAKYSDSLMHKQYENICVDKETCVCEKMNLVNFLKTISRLASMIKNLLRE